MKGDFIRILKEAIREMDRKPAESITLREMKRKQEQIKQIERRRKK